MMNLVGIGEHGLIGAHRQDNRELGSMGEGIGGQVDEDLDRKHRRRSRGVVDSAGMFRETFPARIGDF